VGVEGETIFLTRYCFSLISLGTYALRLCLVCVVDVRVRLRSSVGILEEALDLTADLCTALFLQMQLQHVSVLQHPMQFCLQLLACLPKLLLFCRCRDLWRVPASWIYIPGLFFPSNAFMASARLKNFHTAIANVVQGP